MERVQIQVTIDWVHSQYIVWMYSSLYHKSSTSYKFLFVMGGFSLILYFRTAQTFSIGFMSGLFPGYSRTLIPASFNFCFMASEEWHGALSCCRTYSFKLSYQSISCGMTLESISFKYWSLFVAPSTIWSHPGTLIEMMPQNITFSGCFAWVARSSGAYGDSPAFL